MERFNTPELDLHDELVADLEQLQQHIDALLTKYSGKEVYSFKCDDKILQDIKEILND